MSDITYNIVLQTQLGDRTGTMNLKFDNSNIEGVMSVLGYDTPFRGKQESDGSCTIWGQLKTFMSLMDYTGTGTASPEKTEFLLCTPRSQIRLLGTACETEVQKNPC